MLWEKAFRFVCIGPTFSCFQTGIHIFLFTDVFIKLYKILKDLLFIFKHTQMYTFYFVLNHANPKKNWLKLV